ncbi:type VI secretion system tube protein Hcp [Paraburkholderia sp. MMS20-SJTR3]|uniref:Type VI secretion system tube protein Hcp n=1 Tax=Paraburkholderia sejongensis TaxID=2886946 RepID=A0ABS8K2J2_9BURK|nr:type VI secretion system tube protein Hcp [Paraburkholderia sp. MMS20-SJTR3]MCC8396372.1 type VI secretion system tube protein Hcp [Paraburkholderia sp. MMS20-SJTR3]
MSDMFVKIDGIAGESKDEFHPNEIEVNSWRWKMEQLSSMLTGASPGAPKATIVDLQFVHQIDRSSPNLMRYCLTGRRIPTAVLTTRKAGGVPMDFLKITMENVVITSVEPIVFDNSYFEHVSMSFSRVKQEYKLQGGAGTSAGTVTASFDIKENREQ